MVIVASELDESSERIISYLAEERDVNINAVFFRFFRDSGVEHLGRAWLKDPIETLERSESKKHAPWLGYWFVNAGEGEPRNWDDNRQYGYVGAGQGPRCSRALLRLHPDDQIFVYMKGFGYVGSGVVTREAAPSSEFVWWNQVASHCCSCRCALPRRARIWVLRSLPNGPWESGGLVLCRASKRRHSEVFSPTRTSCAN